MQNLIDLGNLSHRSRERVRDLGEVFTPEYYVQEMISLIDKKTWSDENSIFFEPTCGHGNIVLTLLKKRIDGLYEKALKNNLKDPTFYAIANALNTIWAVDIDSKNIDSCKTRVLLLIFEFLASKNKVSSEINFINKNKKFFTHLICALNWQIFENEALSGLSSKKDAQSQSKTTQIGSKWFQKNNHREIDFHYSWVNYYMESIEEGVIPDEFIKAEKYISSLINGIAKKNDDYNFVNILFAKNQKTIEV